MRDPARINNILQQLGKLWEQVPDWRLGQLFCNLQRHEGADLFFYEDDKLLKAIEEFLNPEAKKNQEG